MANKGDPDLMEFQKKDIESFSREMYNLPFRLDTDEKNHSFYLIEKNTHQREKSSPKEHVEQIHIHKPTSDITLIPELYQKPLLNIMEQYTKGYCILQDEQWKPIKYIFETM
jgi:hypothetical protein